MKYFIISQPKAGTYLAANLFVELGIDPTWMHINEKKFEKYDPNNWQDCRKNASKYRHYIPIEESLSLINDNQFAVGHLKYRQTNIKLLEDFRCIFLMRDLDEITRSGYRWVNYSGRPGKDMNKFSKRASDMTSWQNENVFVLNFEDMKNKNITRIDELQHYLFGKILVASEHAMDCALNTDSLTRIAL